MPLQASTQWDGLGHIFDHGNAWNGRRAGDVVTSEGDLVTGIQTATGRISGRGVLLDVGRAIGQDGELPDGFAITTEHLEQTIAAQGPSADGRPRRLLLVRTGRLARARREGWGDYAGGAVARAVVHHGRLAARAARSPGSPPTPGVSRSGRTSSRSPSSRCTRSCIPHIGLFIGELWDLDALAADCAADGVYEFWLSAEPLPVTGAVGAPVAPVAVK